MCVVEKCFDELPSIVELIKWFGAWRARIIDKIDRNEYIMSHHRRVSCFVNLRSLLSP